METRVLIPSSLTVSVEEPSKSFNYKTWDKIPIKKEPGEEDANNSDPDYTPELPTSSSKSRKRRDVEEGEDTEVAEGSTSEEESNLSPPSRSKKSLEISSDPSSPRIRIVTKYFLPKGTRFHPNEGGIQGLPPLGEHLLPLITPHDIRHVFGCVDRIVSESGISLRLCNWLRFLRTPSPSLSPSSGESLPNIVGSFHLHSGQVDFTTTSDLPPGAELIASFDISSLASLHSNINHAQTPPSLKDTPLDLSAPPSTPTIGGHHSHSHSHLSQDEDEDKADPDWRSPRSRGQGRGRGQSAAESGLSLRQKLIPFSISAVLGRDLGSGSGSSGGSLLRPTILRTRGRERSLLPCEVCGKAFDRPSLLKRHMRTHTGEKPHVCDVCGKGFSTSSSLNTHRRIHSGEKPHQCGVCGKRFTASSNLYYHRMTHNKEKPHKCVLCGKSFPTPGDLKSHQYVHSGSWPYNCAICHRGFSKQTNLRNHLLLHSGDKPHNCHLCPKKFALACNLRAHLRTHEEEEEAKTGTASVGGAVSTKTPPPPKGDLDLKIPPFQAQQHFHHSLSNLPSASFSPFGYGHTPLAVPPPPTNPFLEQLFQWNYRFAKETAGNLGMMQQKLLESQMLAAHLMIGSGAPPSATSSVTDPMRLLPLVPFSVSELIRASAGGSGAFRLPSTQISQDTPTTRTHQLFPTDLNKFM